MSIEPRLVRRLAEWLAPRLAAESEGPVAELELSGFSRPPAGQSSDTLLFEAVWLEGESERSRSLVLRRQRADGLFLHPDAVREAQVIQGLEPCPGVPVPHVVGAEPDPAVMGAPFFVMDRVAGRIPAAKPSIHATGWLTTLTRAERERLWYSAMEALVSLHDHDWRRTHEFLIPVAGDETAWLARHIESVVAWYRWATDGRPFPVTDAAVAELLARRHTVACGPPVLVWGDARPGNMVFDETGRCVALLDWELAAIGPPELDLAHWLVFDDFATGAAGIDLLPGWPDHDTTVARYESMSGRSVGDLWFFELLEELVVATTLIRQADLRVRRGLAPPGTRMGRDNTLTQMLARRLGLPVPELSPDYVAYRTPDRSGG